MKKLRKLIKKHPRVAFLATVLFIGMHLYPTSIEDMDVLYRYNFGYGCSYLKIYREELLLSNLDIFHVCKGAHGFGASIIGMIVCMLIAVLYAIIILKVLEFIKGRVELRRKQTKDDTS